MKNYISKATLALIVALSATSCSDFLDEKLKSELAPDNTYTSTYGFEVGSTGLYAEARSEYNTWGETVPLCTTRLVLTKPCKLQQTSLLWGPKTDLSSLSVT